MNDQNKDASVEAIAEQWVNLLLTQIRVKKKYKMKSIKTNIGLIQSQELLTFHSK